MRILVSVPSWSLHELTTFQANTGAPHSSFVALPARKDQLSYVNCSITPLSLFSRERVHAEGDICTPFYSYRRHITHKLVRLQKSTVPTFHTPSQVRVEWLSSWLINSIMESVQVVQFCSDLQFSIPQPQNALQLPGSLQDRPSASQESFVGSEPNIRTNSCDHFRFDGGETFHRWHKSYLYMNRRLVHLCICQHDDDWFRSTSPTKKVEKNKKQNSLHEDPTNSL